MGARVIAPRKARRRVDEVKVDEEARLEGRGPEEPIATPAHVEMPQAVAEHNAAYRSFHADMPTEEEYALMDMEDVKRWADRKARQAVELHRCTLRLRALRKATREEIHQLVARRWGVDDDESQR